MVINDTDSLTHEVARYDHSGGETLCARRFRWGENYWDHQSTEVMRLIPRDYRNSARGEEAPVTCLVCIVD